MALVFRPEQVRMKEPGTGSSSAKQTSCRLFLVETYGLPTGLPNRL